MEELRFIPSSKLHQSQAVTKHPNLPNKVYTWSSRGKSTNKEGDEVRYFACTGCRSLKDSGRNVSIPVRRANITQNVWETNAKVIHSCTSRDHDDVVGIGLSRKVKKKVANGELRATPAQAAVRLSTSVLRSFGNLDEERQQKIRRSAIGKGRWRVSLMENSSYYAEVVVMASPRQLEWLRTTKLIVSDGSFKYAPRNAYQVYRIFGFVSDTHCVPLVTALLVGKSEAIYEKMWAAVANNLPDYLIDFALFDFEPASIAAFKRHFPEAFAKMCVFHALQALNRRLQQLGLQTLYQEGGLVRSIIRRLGAIVTVPPEYMDDAIIVMSRAIDLINVPAEVKGKFRTLVDYFDDTWVGNRLGKVFLSMLLTGPGTTNHAESYHGRLRDHFPRSHPKLGEWMVTFKELNHHEEEQALAVLQGNVAPNGPTAVFQALQQRRLDLSHQFDTFLDTDFTSGEFRSECYRYLGRMANILGISPQSRMQRRDARAEERARQRAGEALRRIEEDAVAESGPEDNNPSDQSENETEDSSSEDSSAGSDEENIFD